MIGEKCYLVTFDWGRGEAEPTSDSLWAAEMLGVLVVVESHHNLPYLWQLEMMPRLGEESCHPPGYSHVMGMLMTAYGLLLMILKHFHPD